jgi:fused signal recognition particle receptor
MLGWFKKKKTIREDTIPVSDGILEEERQTAEVAEAVTEVSAVLDPGRENAISEAVESEEQAPKQDNQKGLFKRLQESLSKTRDSLVSRVDDLFLGRKEIDAKLLDELEEILITADLGVNTTLDLLDEIRSKVSRQELKDPQALKLALKERILTFFEGYDAAEMKMPEKGPFVIMVVGVNGVGKTTTIGKIADKFVRSGQSVLLVAADTFRAAAIDQ